MSLDSFIFTTGTVSGTLRSVALTVPNITIDVSSATFNGNIDSDLLPSTGDTFNVGSTGNRWNHLYVADIKSDSISIDDSAFISSTGTNLNDVLLVTAAGITFTGNIFPHESGVSNLGNISNPLNNIYAADIISPGLDSRYFAITGGTIDGLVIHTSPILVNTISAVTISDDLIIVGKDAHIAPANNIFLKTNNDLKLQVGLTAIYASVDVIPNAVNVNLGDIASPFQDIYVNNIFASGTSIWTSGTWA